jgi:hypothetical protein
LHNFRLEFSADFVQQKALKGLRIDQRQLTRCPH